MLTNADFAAVEFHATRTEAGGAKRSLHAEMTAPEVTVSALVIIYKIHRTVYTITSAASKVSASEAAFFSL